MNQDLIYISKKQPRLDTDHSSTTTTKISKVQQLQTAMKSIIQEKQSLELKQVEHEEELKKKYIKMIGERDQEIERLNVLNEQLRQMLSSQDVEIAQKFEECHVMDTELQMHRRMDTERKEATNSSKEQYQEQHQELVQSRIQTARLQADNEELQNLLAENDEASLKLSYQIKTLSDDNELLGKEKVHLLKKLHVEAMKSKKRDIMLKQIQMELEHFKNQEQRNETVRTLSLSSSSSTATTTATTEFEREIELTQIIEKLQTEKKKLQDDFQSRLKSYQIRHVQDQEEIKDRMRFIQELKESHDQQVLKLKNNIEFLQSEKKELQFLQNSNRITYRHSSLTSTSNANQTQIKSLESKLQTLLNHATRQSQRVNETAKELQQLQQQYLNITKDNNKLKKVFLLLTGTIQRLSKGTSSSSSSSSSTASGATSMVLKSQLDQLVENDLEKTQLRQQNSTLVECLHLKELQLTTSQERSKQLKVRLIQIWQLYNAVNHETQRYLTKLNKRRLKYDHVKDKLRMMRRELTMRKYQVRNLKVREIYDMINNHNNNTTTTTNNNNNNQG